MCTDNSLACKCKMYCKDIVLYVLYCILKDIFDARWVLCLFENGQLRTKEQVNQLERAFPHLVHGDHKSDEQ